MSFEDNFSGDPQSSKYDLFADKYAASWRDHVPNQFHYEMSRKATVRYLVDLFEKGVKPKDSVAVILGPGFNIAEYRDLDPVIVDAMLNECPAIVVADFSREVLKDARRSLSSASKEVEPKIFRAQREFSGGMSTRFDIFIANKIDTICTVDALDVFMRELDALTPTEIIAKVKEQNLEESESVGDATVVHEHTNHLARYYDFKSVARSKAEVRYVICNLLLAGMLATTEAAFREKLITFRQGQGDEVISDETVRGYLRSWHRVISIINTEIAVNLISGVMDHNPHATISIVTDENTEYSQKFGKHPRWDLEGPFGVRSGLLSHQIMLMENGQSWMQDDSGENPPHGHYTSALIAQKVSDLEESTETK
ncbi:hypothetical protein A3D88_04585 [Candidatus Peribacteria bacterium RIFCSPHIGHO2_02_FULL_52_16]|nr:MAG: hypothetical protein A2706_03215 [Candidatus Peribacteria bacterium RIFCSPHIGHO2_01_FULL_51_35]OGJ60882.1 MAG: hypothetical protein A3D88_04585 [Candidatus Peribacteria bacterium RIFCSPHIGHO2_02_FULL_52_16]